MTFKRDADPQCFGMVRGTLDCDCSAGSTDCLIGGSEKRTIVDDSAFRGAVIVADNADTTIAFDSIRGTATSNTISVQSSNDASVQLDIEVSVLGRTRVCVPSGSTTIPGYPDC